ncbi:MAG TPA: cytochrome c oxidase assembly protein [Burkholderiales bacterium]|nr:cytochrome c oxidase assembly protein [Burkholderiales bacterium]
MSDRDDRARSNRLLLRKLLVCAAVMFGFAFALAPFYEKICEATGIRNVFQPDALAAQNTQVDAARDVSVEFDANTRRLPWVFKPLQASVSVHPGEVTQVLYEVRNELDRPVTGQAVPSYGPQQAAPYFKKMECFCFQQQTLGPGEVRKMPVVFVIDPKLPKEINTITLSYTFFEVNGAQGSRG